VNSGNRFNTGLDRGAPIECSWKAAWWASLWFIWAVAWFSIEPIRTANGHSGSHPAPLAIPHNKAHTRRIHRTSGVDPGEVQIARVTALAAAPFDLRVTRFCIQL